VGGEVEGFLGEGGHVGPFGKVLTEESVGVFVRPSLPRALGIAEVDVDIGVNTELGVLGHLCALISPATRRYARRFDPAGNSDLDQTAERPQLGAPLSSAGTDADKRNDTVVAVDEAGIELGSITVGATPEGHFRLVKWAARRRRPLS